MKIITLKPVQTRLWLRNLPVLVYSDTGEGVLNPDGNPIHPTREEIQAILKASKRGKLFDVEHSDIVDGKPVTRQCHFVNGRAYLLRTYVRIHNQPVQLRMSSGQVLGMCRPKFPGHDIAKSECPPVESKRPYSNSVVPVSPAVGLAQQVNVGATPRPDDCSYCNLYSKPLGCRSDEHHFTCPHHDNWERLLKSRKELVVDEPLDRNDTQPMQLKPQDVEPDTIMVIDLETGEALREASPDEITEAKETAERTGTPIIDIGGKQYAIGDSNFAMMG